MKLVTKRQSAKDTSCWGNRICNSCTWCRSNAFIGYISEYDLHIAKKLAYVIAGGKVPYGTEVDEQYLLDVEREAFISLVSEMKSQARMRHMLVKGKPLRN